MKNHIKSLLAASLLVSSVAQADNVSNKTFMQPRPVGLDLARQDSIWHRQIHRPKMACPDEESYTQRQGSDKGIGAHFQFTGFFEENTNKSGVGRYFGFGGNSTLVVGTAGVAGVQIDNRNLIFNNGTLPANTLAGTIHLKGKQRAAGVEIDYFQNLDCLLRGLYFLVTVPVANVKNKLELNVTGETTQVVNGVTVGIADYFSGNIVQPAGSNQQGALTSALITGGNSSETGVADVHLMIGYDFFKTTKHHFGINVGADFPTGNKAHGRRAFQAIVGNGSFYTVGAGITASTIPWHSCHQSIEFFFDVRYRYVFKGDATRTLGIIGQNWGQYQFVGQTGVLGVIPAANVLTRKVSVTPRNQIDATAIFSYNLYDFTLDVGYEIFAQESEKVHVKSWTDNTYALAGNNYVGTVAFNLATNIAGAAQTIAATAAQVGAGTPIQRANLDTTPAKTPGFVTNKIYSALGYRFAEWCVPLMLKVGGYYEFAPTRKSLQKWGVFGGFGLNF